jgi:hypothetical protein
MRKKTEWLISEHVNYGENRQNVGRFSKPGLLKRKPHIFSGLY